MLFQCLTTTCHAQLQLIYLLGTDDALDWQMQKERALCTDWAPERLSHSVCDANSTGALQINSSTPLTAQRKEKHWQKGIPKERGFVCMYRISKSVFCAINSQSWASQERLCKYSLSSVAPKELICLTHSAVLSNRLPYLRGTEVMTDLLLIALPSCISHYWLDLQGSATFGFSGLAKCGKGCFQ